MGILDRFFKKEKVLDSSANSAELAAIILKAALDSKTNYADEADIKDPQREFDDTEAQRRAIHSISNWYNTLGVYRQDFDRDQDDKLAKSPYFALCEKAMVDYFSTLEYSVTDEEENVIDDAMDFLERPNPQESLRDVLSASLKDTVRYDAGAIVKSFNRAGYMTEMKAYSGPEFWKEIDRVPVNVRIQDGAHYVGYWSHGYTQRYWQRSATGLYISFHPDEVAYLMMYPRSNNIYGTDFIKNLQWFIQYLLDSTRAAGKTFENGVVPSLIWNHPVLSKQQLAQRIEEVNLSNKGSYKFGGILHTVTGEDIKTLSHTLIDMQWLEGQQFVAQLVWAMWGFSMSEFMEGGQNRAASYVQRNITKSRMLKPLMKYYENKINREILPYLEGYQEDWTFKFVRDLDYDDEQKIATINATKANTALMYYNAGVPMDLALQLAGVGDDLRTIVRESLMDVQEGMGGDNWMDIDEMTTQVGEGETGGMNLSPPQDTGEYKTTPNKKEETTGEKPADKFQKSRNYIANASLAPEGARVVRGRRGGMYYETSQKERSSKDEPNKGRSKKKGRRGWSGSQESGSESQKKPPTSKEDVIHLSGKNIHLIIDGADIHVYKNKPSIEVAKFMKSCLGPDRGEYEVKECAMKAAEKFGLQISGKDI